jgi:type IV pilus assembly protein PilM
MEFPSKWLAFFKKMFGPQSGQSVLGLDIGLSSLKVVQLRKEKERAILETYGEIAVGPYGGMEVGRVVKLPQEKIAEALKDLVKEANVKTKKAAVAVPLWSSFVTVINIPAIEGKDISEMVKLEARRYIPVPITEVVLDWWIFPEDKISETTETVAEKPQKTFSKVLLVAIHKDAIEQCKNIVAKAGLSVDLFELESFSMLRSSLKRETAPVAVIDFGASSTKVAIVDFGIMKSSYAISKGAQDLTLALSNSLGIDFKRAEEMKREIDLSDLPEHKEMVSVLEPLLEFIFSEINSVIKDYQRKNGQTVSRTIVVGGGALLKGLVGFAVKRLAMEVNLADPFSKTEYPAFLEKVLKEAGPNFSIALGLALRKLQ